MLSEILAEVTALSAISSVTIVPLRIFAEVTEPSTIFSLVTELSESNSMPEASFEEVIVPLAISSPVIDKSAIAPSAPPIIDPFTIFCSVIRICDAGSPLKYSALRFSIKPSSGIFKYELSGSFTVYLGTRFPCPSIVNTSFMSSIFFSPTI